MYRVYATKNAGHDHASLLLLFFCSILDWSIYSINSFLQIFVIYDGGRCLNSWCRIHFSSMESFSLELFRGVERDLNMLKTALITKSPCLFLEKFTLKKKNGVRGHGFT